MIKPVICFYKKKYIYCTDYIHLTNNQTENPFDFLNQIKTTYSMNLKIVQIDFIDSKDHKAQCHVFILKNYTLLNQLPASNNSFEFNFTSLITKSHFIKTVETIKKDIRNGRYYQINFTAGLQTTTPSEIHELNIFYYYAHLFKSAYTAYLPLPDSTLLSYSPELFLKKEHQKIITQPIKGSATTSEELKNSLKEHSELSMIVDLLRNDLQSVCTKPVEVTAHQAIMQLPYIVHTYSEITGETYLDLPEILKRMLPAGSISGCPKIESLKAIAEYENYHRGIYSGHIGWWQDSDFELSVSIRTFSHQNNKLKYYAGCGIVYDSEPESEWNEFLKKSSRIGRIQHG